MSRFVLSFFSDSLGNRSHMIEAESKEAALHLFFEKHITEYTKNQEGFVYFREDFEDAERPLGTILEIQ